MKIKPRYSTLSKESPLFYQIMKDSLLISSAFMMNSMSKKLSTMQRMKGGMKIIH